MGNVEETASKLARFGEDYGGGTAYLLVVDSDTSSTFSLPRTGTIVVGRSAECDLRVQHASVSRRHATIRVDDGVVRIADLGSHNGTRVNGEPVAESRTLASGDVATVGDVVLVVHFSAPAPVARAAYGEAQWRRRLAEELERAMTFKRMLGVVAVLDAGRNAVAALGGGVRLIDVVGTGDDGQALILLPEVDRDQARSLAEQAIAAIPGARGGLAMCPSDAVDADSILLAARSAARRAEPGCVAQAAEAVTWIELGERRVLVADPAMMKLFALLERIAPSGLPVLITGETGVGKENAAYAVHRGRRSHRWPATSSCTAAPSRTSRGRVPSGTRRARVATASAPTVIRTEQGSPATSLPPSRSPSPRRGRIQFSRGAATSRSGGRLASDGVTAMRP